MNIKVTKEDLALTIDVHGGGFSIDSLNICVDKNLEARLQRNIVINEVIEAFCRPWSKDIVDELVDMIVDALDQLD